MTILDINQIKKRLPHRYPFLLVDRVTELAKNESIVAIKNVTVNEPFFNGHFPPLPVMPGVLMIEALAQAAGILIVESLGLPEDHDQVFLLAGVDNSRFKTMVTPGDQLILTVKLDKVKRTIWKFEAQAEVGDKLCCRADIMIAQGSRS